MMRAARAAIAVALAAGLWAGAVTHAGAQSNCSTYGYLALKQARENEQRKCGKSGPRWSTDLNAHVAWCGTVGPQQWKAELRTRAKELQDCGK